MTNDYCFWQQYVVKRKDLFLQIIKKPADFQPASKFAAQVSTEQ
ncbi:MAG: hypothetical protein QM640_11990 [Niabella sp.]